VKAYIVKLDEFGIKRYRESHQETNLMPVSKSLNKFQLSY